MIAERFKFYVGLHVLSHLQHFKLACVSINSFTRDGGFRKKMLAVDEDSDILLDSGAFTEIARFHKYRHTPQEYAVTLRRIAHVFGKARVTAVSQDMMCEPFMLALTGLTVRQHQEITIERYRALLAENLPMPLLPVLQGYTPREYIAHLEMYGDLLTPGMWVGVGSVCKRNVSPIDIANVLFAIKWARPDLQLHGFGVKKTALMDATVRKFLATADSMAWSYAARRERNGSQNDWREAERFRASVESETLKEARPWQPSLSL